ncbi:MAG: hypothetical protein ABSF26_09810 [Thermoguttaceae bacterium]
MLYRIQFTADRAPQLDALAWLHVAAPTRFEAVKKALKQRLAQADLGILELVERRQPFYAWFAPDGPLPATRTYSRVDRLELYFRGGALRLTETQL